MYIRKIISTQKSVTTNTGRSGMIFMLLLIITTVDIWMAYGSLYFRLSRLQFLRIILFHMTPLALDTYPFDSSNSSGSRIENGASSCEYLVRVISRASNMR
jgi:hypothetical protein